MDHRQFLFVVYKPVRECATNGRIACTAQKICHEQENHTVNRNVSSKVLFPRYTSSPLPGWRDGRDGASGRIQSGPVRRRRFLRRRSTDDWDLWNGSEPVLKPKRGRRQTGQNRNRRIDGQTGRRCTVSRAFAIRSSQGNVIRCRHENERRATADRRRPAKSPWTDAQQAPLPSLRHIAYVIHVDDNIIIFTGTRQ